MSLQAWLWSAAAFSALTLGAEVPELTKLAPDAKDYQLIAKLNPLTWNQQGYEVDNTMRVAGDLKRVGYLLKLTAKDGKESWVFTSMDTFAKTPAEVAVPAEGGKPLQLFVNNLEVAGNVDGLEKGKFERGNLEFWATNYGPANDPKIPGASDKSFDFGDKITPSGNYGSMQVHNFAKSQTVFAFNKFTGGTGCDLGIGNNPAAATDPKQNPDWTFSSSGSLYAKAELYVVGTFDNYQLKAFTGLDVQKVSLAGVTDKDPVSYKPGEEMVFTITPDLQNQQPSLDGYVINWTRTGDDGKTVSGKSPLAAGPFTVKTSLDRPGFVRVLATLSDPAGRELRKTYPNKKVDKIFFDGGAGVEPEKLAGIAEPEDFDAFWAKQKAKLATVPLKPEMKKIESKLANSDVYEVTIPCPGPRPVTGYLVVPAGAAGKSLPAKAMYQGYGVYKQAPPTWTDPKAITFHVNAHGFELNQNDRYYTDYAESIKSNGQQYAFDPKQNENPETAYFNGMALRVLRSLEFLKSLPQWNGKDLVASGGSQGGLQTVWAAALDPDVTLAQPGIPWGCDYAGGTVGRMGATWRIPYVRALDYYDCINHAKRIKCPVEITRAGLGDYTCPPSGVAILYNNLKSPKKINYYQGSTHGFIPDKPQITVRSAQ
ncbi:MAG: acetylxylan esterase [Victivallaceae bacterium]